MLLSQAIDTTYMSQIEKFEYETLSPILEKLSYVGFAVGFLIFLYYLIKLLSLRQPKDRYDFIGNNEVNFLWYTIISLIISTAFIVDSLHDLRAKSIVWFLLKIVVLGVFSVIVGVIFFYTLKFYYPFFLEKRLKKIRYKTRVNPANGNKMKLLSEEEEDVYLDEGMQAEEDVFSVDYDVWIDEETGYTIIEKYQGNLTANACPECSYQTMKIMKEEVIVSPTESSEGEIERFYKCSYCSHKLKNVVKVAPLKKKE